MKIIIKKCVYKLHPMYDLYAGSKDGRVVNIIKKIPLLGNMQNSGYLGCMVRKHAQSGQKTYQVHQFIWECFNGVIPEGKVIDHINNNKEDNRLCNLQLLTNQQNCKKAVKDGDYTFAAKNHENRKCIKATNKDTNEVTYFRSMYAVKQFININPGIVKMACEGLNNCKSGFSKKDGCYYTFEYIKEEDLPEDHRKSSNIRPKRVSDEEKKKHQMEYYKEWQQKEWICLNCGKTYKNNYMYAHKKRCHK